MEFLLSFMMSWLWFAIYVVAITQPLSNSTGEGFVAKWNVPSAPCQNYGSPLQPQFYNIETNEGQSFNGSVIVIFYSLGLFPYMQNGTWMNGGVPQNGNLSAHLIAATEDINQMIPDPDFCGSAVIDFEDWRPVWALTGGTQQVYKDVSIELVRQAHPNWTEIDIVTHAKNDFETAGREYLYATLELGKQLRPKGLWGYYGYPYVDNYEKGEKNVSKQYERANDELSFLINNSTAIYVSIYIFKDNLTSAERGDQVQGRIYETLRVRKIDTIPILPYWWFLYHEIDEFLTMADIVATIGTVYQNNMNGLIIWGGSDQVNSYETCSTLDNYLNTELGPYVLSLVQSNVSSCFN